MGFPFKTVLFHPVRLLIVEELYNEEYVPFLELKSLLKLTDGNLSHHVGVLVREKLVSVKKEIIGKKIQTSFKLTFEGKKNLDSLIEWFYQTFIEGGAHG